MLETGSIAAQLRRSLARGIRCGNEAVKGVKIRRKEWNGPPYAAHKVLRLVPCFGKCFNHRPSVVRFVRLKHPAYWTTSVTLAVCVMPPPVAVTWI